MAFTAISRTRSLPFDDFAGTPPPRRETKRPKQARKSLPVKTQLTMNLVDPAGVALFGSDTQTNGDDEDNLFSGPSPLPIPVKPKPYNPRNPTAMDIRDAHAPPVFPQMSDWPGLASSEMGLSTSGQVNGDLRISKPELRRGHAAYDLGQNAEKDGFLKLLAELCQGIEEPPPSTGRPRMPMRDMVYSVVHKVYSLFSYRRHTRELKEAKARGYINQLPEFSTVCRYMRNFNLTHILMDLVAASAIPMRDIDTRMASESTDFLTCHFVRWFNHLWGGETNTRERLKVDLDYGVGAKIVSAVAIPGWQARDTNFFEPLPDRTVAHFDPESLTADPARPNNKNEHWAMLEGVVPFIPFKSKTSIPTDESNSVWAAMHQFFRYNKGQLHYRSNVESAGRMIKDKFGDSLRSKNYISQVNETLAKVLSHNIVENHKTAVMLGLDENFEFQFPLQEWVS